MEIKPYQDPTKNYTPVHNAFFDVIMPDLKPTSFKVLCFIFRKTHGWHKAVDDISFSQIKTGTGIKSNHTVIAALKELSDKGHIITVIHEEQWQSNSYAINIDFTVIAPESNLPGVENALEGGLSSAKNAPSLGVENALDSSAKNAHTKDTLKTTDKNKVQGKINFALPPYPHSSLSGEVVFFQDGDTLHRAIVTRVMAKTLNLTFTESGDKKKHVRPAGAVFYQNGSGELSPVEVEAADKEKKLSDGETAIMKAIIGLMPDPGFIAEDKYKKARRMKEIVETARKAHTNGIKAEEFEAFGIWHKDVSWAGRDSPPPITLETIRKNWAQFQIYRGGTNGQLGRRNQAGQSGVSGQARGVTSDQTAAYIEQNRDNLQRKVERLTR